MLDWLTLALATIGHTFGWILVGLSTLRVCSRQLHGNMGPCRFIRDFIKSDRLLWHVCSYVDRKGSAAMLTSTQSAGVAPQVNLRITQVRKHTKGIHPGFETQGRCHQTSKTGLSKAPWKGLISSKTIFKKIRLVMQEVENGRPWSVWCLHWEITAVRVCSHWWKRMRWRYFYLMFWRSM